MFYEQFKIKDVDFLSFFFKLNLIKFELDFKGIERCCISAQKLEFSMMII